MLVVGGKTSSLFLDCELGVDVVGKEADLGYWKMVDLMDEEKAIAFLEGLIDFGDERGTHEGALLVVVVAGIDDLVKQRCVNVLVDAGGAEGDGGSLSLQR